MKSDRQDDEIERCGEHKGRRIQGKKENHQEWKKRNRETQQSDQPADGGRVDAQPEIPAEIAFDEVPHRSRLGFAATRRFGGYHAPPATPRRYRANVNERLQAWNFCPAIRGYGVIPLAGRASRSDPGT